MTRKTSWIIGEALALAVIAGSTSIAMAADNGEGDTPLSGSALEKASAAAVAHFGGGTVIETEAGEDGTPYHVEIRLDDGRVLEVDLDETFKVVGEPAADEDAAEQEEPDDEEGPDDEESETQGRLEMIPQPVVESSEIAPESQRVDIAMPTFSNPTVVTNPLFPVSLQESILLLGEIDGEPFRTEVTLLPDTRVIKWQGQMVETLVSQYVAFIGGRIHEVAYDLYAQADDGSVWYFGEDVLNFADGVIVDTHGTWHAGKDGPAAMIMPANPRVGDVYRPENIPGLVFEEVTVKAVDQILEGPLGPVEGGLVVEELHLMDNSREEKTFAPGYGEFFTGSGGDVEALALAVPTDALPGPEPTELATLKTGAADIFEAAQAKDWNAAVAAVTTMTAAWEGYRAGAVPTLIEPRMSASLEALSEAVHARKATQSRQAAIDTAQWSLDLQLRHRPPAEIDLARFDLWAAQLLVDAAGGDAHAVNGDFFTLDLIRDRIIHSLDTVDAVRINTQLEELLGAVGDKDLPAATEGAESLRDMLAGLHPAG